MDRVWIQKLLPCGHRDASDFIILALSLSTVEADKPLLPRLLTSTISLLRTHASRSTLLICVQLS